MSQNDSDKTLAFRRQVSLLVKDHPCVVVVEGASIGKQVRLDGDVMIVGRAEDAAISLDDKLISREHAKVLAESVNGVVNYYLVDLGSTNGTYLNGLRVGRASLHEGDKIHVGNTILRFSHYDEVDSKYQRRIYDLINYDDLTGLFTLRFFYAELEKELNRAKRAKIDLGVLMMDLDHFKSVNDEHGHQTGSYVLKEVGRVLRESLRLEDVAGRYGGEEFIAYLPATSSEEAVVCANRVRKVIARTVFQYEEHKPLVRISIGVASYPQNGQTIEALVRRADDALYQAKKRGRNRVEAFQGAD